MKIRDILLGSFLALTSLGAKAGTLGEELAKREVTKATEGTKVYVKTQLGTWTSDRFSTFSRHFHILGGDWDGDGIVEYAYIGVAKPKGITVGGSFVLEYKSGKFYFESAFPPSMTCYPTPKYKIPGIAADVTGDSLKDFLFFLYSTISEYGSPLSWQTYERINDGSIFLLTCHGNKPHLEVYRKSYGHFDKYKQALTLAKQKKIDLLKEQISYFRENNLLRPVESEYGYKYVLPGGIEFTYIPRTGKRRESLEERVSEKTEGGERDFDYFFNALKELETAIKESGREALDVSFDTLEKAATPVPTKPVEVAVKSMLEKTLEAIEKSWGDGSLTEQEREKLREEAEKISLYLEEERKLTFEEKLSGFIADTYGARQYRFLTGDFHPGQGIETAVLVKGRPRKGYSLYSLLVLRETKDDFETLFEAKVTSPPGAAGKFDRHDLNGDGYDDIFLCLQDRREKAYYIFLCKGFKKVWGAKTPQGEYGEWNSGLFKNLQEGNYGLAKKLLE